MNLDAKKYIITVSNMESVSSPRTISAMSVASRISKQTGLPSALLITGPDILKKAGDMAKELHSDIFAVEVQAASLAPEALLKIFKGIFSEINAGFIIFPETPEYSAVAPALAARLNAAWISGVTGINDAENNLVFSRSVWGGKFLADIVTKAETTVITTPSSEFGERIIRENGQFKVRFMDTPEHESRSVVEGWTYGAKAEAGLKEAKVIISAGQGIGGPENIDLINDLAKLIPGSAVGCSRPVCDQGWMEYKHQVGITGAIVSPKLYIACGISGSSQHIQGMQDSELVIAINTDKNAPFFRHSDIGIVEDVKVFLPELIRQLGET